MTLVLLTPIALDDGCWEGVPLPEGPVIKHVFPGLGGRPRAPRPPTMASLADDVAERCEGELDIAGQSLGGMVALHVALRHPSRVRSLLIACTGAATRPDVMEERATAAEETGMEGVLDVTLERWFTPAALAMAPEHPAVTYARRTLLGLAPEVFAEYWRAIGGHDVVARLHEIAVPTTALAGSEDSASPVERSRALSEGTERGRLVVMAGPHMMALEHPLEFGAALADHLRWAGERRA